jgi:DNA-binding NtrC family response regulator
MLATDTSHLQPDNVHHSKILKRRTPESGEQLTSQHKRIIVVDDEMLIAESLVEILRGEGFQAISFSNGAAAVKWAAIVEPDAVICDVAMPGMDGMEVAKQIRELCPECRIILFSGRAAVHQLLANASTEGHVFEFLPKPVRPEIIISMLRSPKTN